MANSTSSEAGHVVYVFTCSFMYIIHCPIYQALCHNFCAYRVEDLDAECIDLVLHELLDRDDRLQVPKQRRRDRRGRCWLRRAALRRQRAEEKYSCGRDKISTVWHF